MYFFALSNFDRIASAKLYLDVYSWYRATTSRRSTTRRFIEYAWGYIHFLLQLNQTPQTPAGLRALKNTNPRLSHFGIDANTSITVGRRIFCSATWNELNVTLCVAFDLATHVSRKEFYLAPVIEFIDSPPKEIADRACPPGNKQLEGTCTFHLLSLATLRMES